MDTGVTFQDYQNFTRKQKRGKAFQFTTAVGRISVPINLSGTARFLLGVRSDFNATTASGQEHRFTLTINNEIIFEDVHQSYLNSRQSGFAQEYVKFPRMLTGNDEIVLVVNSTVSETQTMYFSFV